MPLNFVFTFCLFNEMMHLVRNVFNPSLKMSISTKAGIGALNYLTALCLGLNINSCVWDNLILSRILRRSTVCGCLFLFCLSDCCEKLEYNIHPPFTYLIICMLLPDRHLLFYVLNNYYNV